MTAIAIVLGVVLLIVLVVFVRFLFNSNPMRFL